MNCPIALVRSVFGVATAVAAGLSLHAAPAPDALRTGFENPPVTARPQTLWFWMNGNITRTGITRDLESMKQAGLGGAIIFEGGIYIPRGPVDYLSPQWQADMAFAAKEADRLGLQLGMHNGPGWSSSGGPWIKPADSMKQLVWTETAVAGPGTIETNLLQPYTKEGFYRDAVVLAFPASPGEEKPFQDRLKRFDAALVDGDLHTGVGFSRDNPLVLEFAEPFEARAITLYLGADAPARRVGLESSDDGHTYKPVTQVVMSPPRGIEFPGTRNFPAVRAKFFRLTPQGNTTLAEVGLHAAPRVEDWNYKGNHAFRIPRPFTAPAEVDEQFALDPEQVRDISKHMDDRGHLRWKAPKGSWVILRLGYTSTGQHNVSAPAAGHGLECDKFDRAAIEKHFQSVQAVLLERMKEAGAKSFVRVEIDSYEAEMQNWTAKFPEEFKQRNSYDLLPYLPAMTGRIVGSAADSERFLFDFRKTGADLMANNYYGRMAELCRAHGLQFYVEPYGNGPFDELEIAGQVDVPMTEFWTRFPWGPNRVVKSVASSAHIYGKSIVASECFTGEEETSRWEEYPYSLKPVGDLMFSLGYNQTFFHRDVLQPHPDARPGMTMGPWGMFMDRGNTWFTRSGGWLDYMARSQFLLQQGNPAADVLCLVPERSPEASQYTLPKVPEGYTYDLVNADVLLHRVNIQDGRIVLPEGTSYRVLSLPDELAGMTPELLNKLDELVSQGMILIGPKPIFNLTLHGGSKAEKQFHRTADKLWAGKEGAACGKGRVFAKTALPDVLRQINVAPDFKFSSRDSDASVVWLHRKLNDGDVYFVANRQRRTDDIVASFRAAGHQPELWDPETGRILAVPVYSTNNGRMELPLHLDPAQSLFVVLRKPATVPPVRSLSRDGVKIVEAKAFSSQPLGPYANLTNTFTVSVWVKPDINLRVMPTESATGRLNEAGKHYVVPAREGDMLFGKGHALMGLAAGRNGVYVVERSTQSAPAVLVARTPLAGWTHLAVVYSNGKPSLYVNGKFVREGLSSGLAVHPGVGVPPGEGVTYYFEGEMTKPEVLAEALTPDRIEAIAASGLPAPDAPPPAELALRPDGKVDALLWQSGHYQLGSGPSLKVEVPAPATLTGPWQVSFPTNHGAPANIEMPELMSLHRHSDPGVRHFSGTATYTHVLHISPEALADGKRVYLDLGRVEVIAEVRLNGREVGRLWKPPYRLDVTGAVRAGDNDLEVRVTNLMPNRLIGDESLPAEDEYDAREHNIVRLPDWYVKGEPKPPGGRTTFATWQFFRADEPLFESGLLGPVRVFNPVQQVLRPAQ